MRAGRVAWSLFGLSVLFAGGALALWAITRSLEISDLEKRATDPAIIVALLPYAGIGSLIVSRRFGNRVGWIFLGVGLVGELGLLAQGYAIYALRWSPNSLPGGSWAGLIVEVLPITVIGLGTFLLLVYPTGHLLSRRWLAVAWLSACSTFVVALGSALGPGTLMSVSHAAKPIQVDFPLFTSGELAWSGALIAGLLAILSVVVRYRSGDAVERQQLRWFLAAVPIFVTSFYWVPSSDILAVIVSFGIASLPVAAGIAILRYRLYDLDLVIKRTLVYGVLSTFLLGLYFGIVLALQQVFSGFTRGNDLAIAGSTLAVAALFRPARRRIQALVDRRFYRRRYDAQQTLEAFSARLRDEVDLQTLGTDLAAVVHTTMQPAHLSLWLRRPEDES